MGGQPYKAGREESGSNGREVRDPFYNRQYCRRGASIQHRPRTDPLLLIE